MRALGLLLLIVPLDLSAQQAQRRLLEGVVREGGGAGIANANIFVVGTLDGVLTDSMGRFAISTVRRAGYDLAVRRIGFRAAQLHVDDSLMAPQKVILEPEVRRAAPVIVRAGRYAAGDEPGATLTPLEIATIPGTAADVNRAIQTLPGLQQVDEGTGLFVRGGDYMETRVFLNDGPLLNPPQLQNAAGTFVGTLDPFLLDGVYFTAGGFGARYGDALSAIAELHTQRRPLASSATISAGLAAIGLSLAVAGPDSSGFRLVGNHNDLRPVVRLNGSPRQFVIAPRGDDGTASAEWNYRPTARVSLFATRQTSLVGALNATPSVTDTFTTSTRERAVVARWSDTFGSIAPSLVVSTSRIDRFDDYGSFRLTSPSRLTGLVTSVESAIGGAVTSRTGIELAWETAGASGSVPASGANEAPGARTRLYDESRGGRRFAQFDEYEWRPTAAFRLTGGVRHETSSLTSSRFYDPRLSGAWRAAPYLSVIGAWGVYHQAVDPLLQSLRADSAAAAPPSMRARQSIVGLQLGDEGLVARVEAYEKSYNDLAGQTRDFVTTTGGVGNARGIDVLVHAASIAGFDARLVYSYVRSRRTDPSSGIVAPASAEVPNSLTLIATRPVAAGVALGASFRYASGRPYTPVVSATRKAGETAYTPEFGPPNSERLPAFARLDLSANWYRLVRENLQVVGYLAISNALDRANVYTRQYTADYGVFYDVRSIFNRSLYVGTVLTFGRSR